MIATPVVFNDGPRNGPRPINLSRDTRQVLDLLDVSFGPVHGLYRQRILANQFSLQGSAKWSLKMTMAGRNFIPGFVWEENGKIVGNATLLQSEIFGRYIVANVAVSPDFRRQGIARGLMQQIIYHVQDLHGQRIMLQVEHDNKAAIGLYQSLGFHIYGTMNRWDNSASHLHISSADCKLDSHVRPLRNHEWQAAYYLDTDIVNPDLTWPTPPSPDLYQNHFWRRLSDFLNGRKFYCWVVDRREGTTISGINIGGLAAIFGEWGRPVWIRFRIAPEYQDQYEQALFNTTFRKLRSLGGNTIKISHPADDQVTNRILRKANFRLERTLAIMGVNIPSDQVISS